jgi:hypothetical protein
VSIYSKCSISDVVLDFVDDWSLGGNKSSGPSFEICFHRFIVSFTCCDFFILLEKVAEKLKLSHKSISMSDAKIYRSSTMAPVNIAVIK